MAVLYATNRLTGLFFNSSGITETTTVGSPARFDNTLVGSAIVRNDDTFLRVPFPSNLTDFWFHFECLYSSNFTSSTVFYEFLNDALVPVIRVVGRGGSSASLDYWNGSAWVQGPSISGALSATAARQKNDFRIITGASGEISWYQGGALVGTISGLNAAVNHVRHMQFRGQGGVQSWLSQIILADEDTRALEMSSDVANSDGTYTDGTGTFDSVNNNPLDPTTAKVMTANGNKFSLNKASRTFPSLKQVEAVFVTAQIRANGGVVTNARPFLRIGSNDYPAANVSPVPNAGYEPRFAKWDLSPATFARFTNSEYNGMQFGWEART